MIKYWSYICNYTFNLNPLRETMGGSVPNISFFLSSGALIFFILLLLFSIWNHKYIYKFLLINVLGFILNFLFVHYLYKTYTIYCYDQFFCFLINYHTFILKIKFLSITQVNVEYITGTLFLIFLLLLLLCINIILLGEKSLRNQLVLSIGYFIIPIIYAFNYAEANSFFIVTMFFYSLLFHFILLLFLLVASIIILVSKKLILMNKEEEEPFVMLKFFSYWTIGSVLLYLWGNAYSLNNYCKIPNGIYDLSGVIDLGGCNAIIFLILYFCFSIYLILKNQK